MQLALPIRWLASMVLTEAQKDTIHFYIYTHPFLYRVT